MVTGTNKREFTDSNFNSAETNLYHLSIETGDDFLYCSVHDEKTGKLLSVDTEKPAYMDASFKSVSCVVINPHFTLVPDDVFEISKCESYLKLNISISDKMNLHHHLIPAVNAWCVYAVEKEMEEKLQKKFPAVLHRHIVSVAVENAILKTASDKNSVWLMVFPGIFVLIFIQKGKLVFCNVFNWKIHEDLAYYLHFAAEQLGCNLSDTDVCLSGPATHPVMEGFLKKFIRINYPENNLSSDNHANRFFTLIHQQACV